MDNITDVQVERLSESKFVKPFRVKYTQVNNYNDHCKSSVADNFANNIERKKADMGLH